MKACQTIRTVGCVVLALLLGCGSSNNGGGAGGSGGVSNLDGGTGGAFGDGGPSGQGGGGQGGTAGGGQGGTSSGGSGGGGQGLTGIAGNKMLNALGADDMAKLCMAGKNVQNTPGVVANLCKLIALIAATLTDPQPMTDGQAQAACTAGFDECKATITDGMCTAVDPGCTATVAQLEACWAATPAYVMSVAAALPACATLTLSQLEHSGDANPPPQPAACVTLDSLGCGDLDLTGGE